MATDGREDLPPEFDPSFYRACNPDLVAVPDDGLLDHYRTWGRHERRRASPAAERSGFMELVIGREEGRILEVGPYAAPLVRGSKVRYLDFAPTEVLRSRAAAEGLSPGMVPRIHYVGAADAMPRSFDAAVACRSIGHHPDLVGHLQSIGRILVEGGRYHLILPDRSRTMVEEVADSEVSALIGAHHEGRTTHGLAGFIADRALRRLHGAPGSRAAPPIAEQTTRIRRAIEEFRHTTGYVDVQSWHFTPEALRTVLQQLFDLDLSPFRPVRVWPTPGGQDEFCATLEKTGR